MTTVIRSWLYCPGSRPDLITKALAGEADAVVVDLEDAVPPDRKSAARDTVVDVLSGARTKPLWVRMNHLDSPWGTADARALAATRPDGVRVPKCESRDQVRAAADVLGCPIGVLVESALGLEHAFSLAAAHEQVASLSLGEADLAADLRVPRDGDLAWARSRLIVAARAAGLPSPPQSVLTAVHDDLALRRSTLEGRRAGHFGRSVIHPRQVPIVNAIYTPAADEVREARRVLDVLSAAARAGRSTGIDTDGRFVDPAVAEQAAWVVELDSAVSAGSQAHHQTRHTTQEHS